MVKMRTNCVSFFPSSAEARHRTEVVMHLCFRSAGGLTEERYERPYITLWQKGQEEEPQ